MRNMYNKALLHSFMAAADSVVVLLGKVSIYAQDTYILLGILTYF